MKKSVSVCRFSLKQPIVGRDEVFKQLKGGRMYFNALADIESARRAELDALLSQDETVQVVRKKLTDIREKIREQEGLMKKERIARQGCVVSSEASVILDVLNEERKIVSKQLNEARFAVECKLRGETIEEGLARVEKKKADAKVKEKKKLSRYERRALKKEASKQLQIERAADPGWFDRMNPIDKLGVIAKDLSLDARQDASENFGVYSGTYLRMDDSFGQAQKSPKKDRRPTDWSPYDPIRHRYGPLEGTIGPQVQQPKTKAKARTADLFFDTDVDVDLGARDNRGRFKGDEGRLSTLVRIKTQVPIEDMEDIWDTRVGKSGRHPLQHVTLLIRVGSDDKLKPIWAEFPMLMHKRIPDGVVRWVGVTRRVDAGWEEWQCTITLDDVRQPQKKTKRSRSNQMATIERVGLVDYFASQADLLAVTGLNAEQIAQMRKLGELPGWSTLPSARRREIAKQVNAERSLPQVNSRQVVLAEGDDDGVVVIHCGYCKEDGKIRVGNVMDDRGRRHAPNGVRMDIFVPGPPDRLCRAKSVLDGRPTVSGTIIAKSIRSIRDQSFESLRDDLCSWMRDRSPTLPEWLREYGKRAETVVPKDKVYHVGVRWISTWRAPSKLVWLARRWAENRFADDEEMFDRVSYWASWQGDGHLWAWESGARRRSLAHRDNVYRTAAAALARRYSVLIVDKTNFSSLAKKDAPDGIKLSARGRRRDGEDGFVREEDAADAQRRDAAPSHVRNFAINAFRMRGRRVIQVESEKLSSQCPCCRKTSVANQDRVERMFTCAWCGFSADVDLVAMLNMLIAAKRRGSAETIIARLRSLAAE